MLLHGVHAIVMDYYITKSAHGFQASQSDSMEGAFLNDIHHVRKQYYQIYKFFQYFNSQYKHNISSCSSSGSYFHRGKLAFLICNNMYVSL